MSLRLIFCHGEKGGPGKSTMCSLIVNRCMVEGLRPVLVEGDVGIPDVAWRYAGIVDGHAVQLSRPDRACDAVGEMMELLERKREEFSERSVVVNLPAGAGTTIDAMAREIGEVVTALGGEVVTVFMIAPGHDSPRSALASLKTGIASISSLKIGVPNAFFGRPASMSWANSDARKAWFDDGGIEFVLPALPDRVSVAIRETRGALSEIAAGRGDGKKLFIFDRSALGRWVRECEPITDAALGLNREKSITEEVLQ